MLSLHNSAYILQLCGCNLQFQISPLRPTMQLKNFRDQTLKNISKFVATISYKSVGPQ